MSTREKGGKRERHLCLDFAFSHGDIRYRYGENEEEEVAKKKPYETNTNQPSTTRDEYVSTTGYEGNKNTSSYRYHRGPPHKQHRTPV